MAQWSDETEFNFIINPTFVSPCEGFSFNDGTRGIGFPAGDGDFFNGTDFSDTVCGNEFGQGVLAITLTISQPGLLGFAHIVQSDILLNTEFKWDIYTGPRRNEVDFSRVVLHELGHALGLEHESSTPAIMSPSITDLDSLQVDDISGVNSIYGGPGDCEIVDININTVILDELSNGDCAVFELYGGGNDTSFVDIYRLTLEAETNMTILMESAELDSVLLLTDNRLTGIDFDDDSGGECDALISGNFPAGEYLILANTYVNPVKCPGNTGKYKISISDNNLPILTNARSISGASTKSIFNGGASTDGGLSFGKNFLTLDVIDVNATISPDPEHVNKAASIYVLVLLSSGEILVKNSNGRFSLQENILNLPEHKKVERLQAMESVEIIKNFIGANYGIKQLDFEVHIGYSLDSQPDEIIFNGEPIVLSIKEN